MGVAIPPIDLSGLNSVIPPFLTGSDNSGSTSSFLNDAFGGKSGATNSGGSSASAQANPTIIIENGGSSSLLPYVLIGLGVVAIIGLVILSGKRGHGGGGQHAAHHRRR